MLHRARAGDDAVRSIAHRALAIAAREQRQLDVAHTELERAIAAAADLPVLRGHALVTLASVLTLEGRYAEALTALDDGEPLVDGRDLALLLMQRGSTVLRLDSGEWALRCHDAALAAAEAAGDRFLEAAALTNRGNTHVYGGRAAEAERDFARAEALFRELGVELAAVDVHHNRGFAAAGAGDLATALRRYHEARQDYDRLGIERANCLLDEARALFEARLLEPAQVAARTAIGRLRASGEVADLPEALLLLAEVSGAAGAPDPGPAEEARAMFEAQGRTMWSSLAAFTALRLRPDVDPGDARRMADELDAAGWRDAALEARLLAGAPADLAVVAEHRKRGPATRRLRGWYAEAMRRRAEGDAAGAARAAAAGVRIAALHAGSLAATDMRARAGVVVGPLVDLGLGVALESRRPRRVLVWAERWRAGGLVLGPAGLPTDAGLGELRAVMRRLDDDGLPTYRRAELDRQRRRLEAEVDRRTRAAATGTGEDDRDLDVDELLAAVGARTLVEYVVHEGQVHPIVVDATGVHLLEPASLVDVGREVRSLRMAANRLARPNGPAAMRSAADAAAGNLDRLLLGRARLAEEVVLVPTGTLHAVPWPLLPSLADRVTTVAPSARLWLRAAEARDRRRALVVTHGVPGGPVEAASVAACYPDAVVLDGAAATSAAVLDALVGVDVAHLAVHATFRADNPLYSSLQLADGPLLVHDLDRLPRTPPVVVLSACGAAQSSVDAGDELLGLTASFLRSGTTSLIASTLPVVDELAPPLMAAFHQALRSTGPAAALRHARASAPAHAGAAFTCFGHG